MRELAEKHEITVFAREYDSRCDLKLAYVPIRHWSHWPGWIRGILFARKAAKASVGPYGLLQGFADTIKLLTKEDLRPASADRWTFELAPFVIFVPVLMAGQISTMDYSKNLYEPTVAGLANYERLASAPAFWNAAKTGGARRKRGSFIITSSPVSGSKR